MSLSEFLTILGLPQSESLATLGTTCEFLAPFGSLSEYLTILLAATFNFVSGHKWDVLVSDHMEIRVSL